MRARRSIGGGPSALLAVLAALAALPWGCADVIGADFDRPFQATGGAGPGSGGGGSAGCVQPADCAGADGECGHRACKGGLCAFQAEPPGTAVAAQASGDCAIVVCDGKGVAFTRTDALDVHEDQNDCTVDACVDGLPVNQAVAGGSPCGPGGKLTCNTSGVCTGCNADAECGQPSACMAWHCADDHTCGPTFAPAGSVIADPTDGDCLGSTCDGKGGVSVGVDDGDAPPNQDACHLGYCSGGNPMWAPKPPDDDGNVCTKDVCDPNGGGTVHPPAKNGAACAASPCGKCQQGACKTQCAAGHYCAPGGCAPKVALGGGCGGGDECTSSHCVDGLCCDAACLGACLACEAGRTGVASGTCAPVKAGDDADKECDAPWTDTCNGAGKCGCHDGVKGGEEVGVDCGGPCDPCPTTWHCGGCDSKVATATAECCKSASDCTNCLSDLPGCKALTGTSCAPGALDVVFAAGHVASAACQTQADACAVLTCSCKP